MVAAVLTFLAEEHALAHDALNAVRPVVAEGPVLCGKRGPYTDRGVRNLLAVLGHRRLDTVRIYAQPDAAAVERAAVALEGR